MFLSVCDIDLVLFSTQNTTMLRKYIGCIEPYTCAVFSSLNHSTEIYFILNGSEAGENNNKNDSNFMRRIIY